MDKHSLSLKALAVALPLALAACSKGPIPPGGPVADWPVIGGSAAGQRFTPLEQITPDNLERLEVAWTYHIQDVSPGTATHGATAFAATPLVVNDSMYLCTPYSRIIALDPESGEERWTYDPQADLTGAYTPTCRGVAHWQEDAPQQACSERIFSGTMDGRLVAVDARSGRPCEGFGDGGSIDLRQNLGDVQLAEYYLTSAPLVFEDLVIAGAFIKDGQRLDAPGGVVRAFDVRTGELRWAFDPVPPGMQPVTAEDARQGATFTRSTPNAWGNLSADLQRGIVYLPTGGSQPDHYRGTERGKMDYYGTSVVAVDARSGQALWHFQTVHHDIWDWDVAAQPVLFDQHGEVPGVIAATKMGHIFLLNRETGEPLFPVEERPVPASTVPGETASPTQPFPTLPRPVHPPALTEDDIWGIYPGDRQACLEQFRSFRYEGIFTPPGLDRPALTWPGLGGGINWGSVSVNPHSNIMVVNSMRVPYTVQLLPRDQVENMDGSDLVGVAPQEGTPWIVVRNGFLSPNNTPCTAPPWAYSPALTWTAGRPCGKCPWATWPSWPPWGWVASSNGVRQILVAACRPPRGWYSSVRP